MSLPFQSADQLAVSGLYLVQLGGALFWTFIGFRRGELTFVTELVEDDFLTWDGGEAVEEYLKTAPRFYGPVSIPFFRELVEGPEAARGPL